MKWNVGTKIGAWFGLTMAIFVIVGAVSYRSTTDLVAAADLRKHAHEVLAELGDVLSLLQDIEIGQRGYVLTGDEAYLEPYQNALGKIAPSIQQVRRLTENTPGAQRHLDTLEPLVKRRLAFTKERIDVKRPRRAMPELRSGPSCWAPW